MNMWVDKKDRTFLTDEDSIIIATIFFGESNTYYWNKGIVPIRFTSLEKAKSFVERTLNES